MEINFSRFVVSNIYNKYVCLVYMHSSYSTVHFIDLYIQYIQHTGFPCQFGIWEIVGNLISAIPNLE